MTVELMTETVTDCDHGPYIRIIGNKVYFNAYGFFEDYIGVDILRLDKGKSISDMIETNFHFSVAKPEEIEVEMKFTGISEMKDVIT